MSERRGAYIVNSPAHFLTVSDRVIIEDQAQWQAELIRKVERLRAQRVRGIIFVTEDGVLLVFRAEPAGRIEP